MVRSAVAALALFVALNALAPSRAAAQEQAAQQATGAHEVVRGNTLWDLAQHFYGNPFLWPRIYEANRDRLEDPDLILPGQVLRIPDLETGEMREVRVVAEDAEEGGAALQPVPRETTPMELSPARGPKPIEYRTTFWREAGPEGMGYDRSEPVTAVPPSQVYSARWLVPLEGEVDRLGQIEGFAGAEEIRGTRQTLMPFDEVRVTFAGGVPPVGSRLQTFRIDGTLEDLGRIAMPTGIVEITQIQPAGAVVVVREAYGRIQPGDFVRALPPFGLVPGEVLQPVSGGPVATVLGIAMPGAIQGIGHQLFLDRGARDGLMLGDVFELVWDGGEWGEEVEGTVQVVSVQEGVATARITNVTNPVFARGVRVRLSQRLPLTQ